MVYNGKPITARHRKNLRKLCWECGNILKESDTACPFCRNEGIPSDPVLRNSFAHQRLWTADVFYECQEDGILYTFTYPLYLKLIQKILPGEELYLELIRTMCDLGYQPPTVWNSKSTQRFGGFAELNTRAINFYLRRDFGLFYRRICKAIRRIFWADNSAARSWKEEIIRYKTEDYHFLLLLNTDPEEPEESVVILTDITETEDSPKRPLASCKYCVYGKGGERSAQCSHCNTLEIDMKYEGNPVVFTYGFIAEFARETGGNFTLRGAVRKMQETALEALEKTVDSPSNGCHFIWSESDGIVFYEFDRSPQKTRLDPDDFVYRSEYDYEEDRREAAAETRAFYAELLEDCGYNFFEC
ncbi:MAG: hypothetical protein K2O18_16545 [Oscillospiraceae bacterium]|nr:hypothetical protein [Oscillospiraceae bacterium]